MSKKSKPILVAFDRRMVAKMDYVANQESMTRSELLREAMRQYFRNYERDGKQIPSQSET